MWSTRRVGVVVVLAVLLVALASSALALPTRVVAWATVLEAGVLAVAALFAWNQLAEMREARVAQTRPHVIAYIHPNPNAHTIIDFVIANVGKSVARDIKLTFAPKLSESSGPAASLSGAHWIAFEGVADPRARSAAQLPVGELVDGFCHRRRCSEAARRHDYLLGRHSGPKQLLRCIPSGRGSFLWLDEGGGQGYRRCCPSTREPSRRS